ncbi:MAG: enoyl-CoA hydratase [Dehalococcoidia bacterium]|nr:MAG: enoyl-CoA hydratase [Dehalococcoidia bacterium]
MAWETILLERDGPLRLLTLNRPHVLNAISRQMVHELGEAFAEVEADRDARVLLITGAPRPDGRPCFSAGADLKEAHRRRQGSPPGEPLRHTLDSAWEVLQNDGPRNESIYHPLFASLERMRTPSIAVVDGICTTGGLELILACDLRIVADTAEISDWHIKNLGVIGGAGVTTRLPQLVGTARAKELMWTGAPLTGEEAFRIGLANRVVPSATLLDEAKALARSIAARSPYAIAASKAVIDAAARQSPADGIRYGYLWSALIALQRQLEGEPPEIE